MSTLAIIQARTTSSRLPGKVLLDIAGQPMLVHVVERTRRAKSVDQVVVATTIDPADDAIEALCRSRGYPVFRGSLHDVLDRFYQAALAYQAQTVVRITADCPLIDPDLIDETVAAFYRERVDFACNRLPPPFHRTYPIGLDVEVVSFDALERAWKEATAGHDREHVLPYLYEVPGRFRIYQLNYARDLGSLRWTVDTPPDLDLVRSIFAHFAGRDHFSWLDTLDFVERNPDLAALNANVQHKTYLDVDRRSRK